MQDEAIRDVANQSQSVSQGIGARERWRLPISEYVKFHREGFLVVPGLFTCADIEPLQDDGLALMQAQCSKENASDQQWFAMLHRRSALHERSALHPAILDVVQALIGEDVMAMQTMLFLKPPGERGNGWHQDSWYLQTIPDSLCGAWVALDRCDEENGALVIAVGSQVEPIYSNIRQPHPDRWLQDMGSMEHLHNPDDTKNELTAIASRYQQRVIHANPGDVVFLHGHVLHTSLPNTSSHRQRRAFVAHYANARSFTTWGSQYPLGHVQHSTPDPALEGMTNGNFILARGSTNLPYASSKFQTGETGRQSNILQDLPSK